jgi:hypothetical protein
MMIFKVCMAALAALMIGAWVEHGRTSRPAVALSASVPAPAKLPVMTSALHQPDRFMTSADGPGR